MKSQWADYRVIGTNITLSFVLPDQGARGAPIESTAMEGALEITLLNLLVFIQLYPGANNSILLNPDDPYMSPSEIQGCYFGVTHFPVCNCLL